MLTKPRNPLSGNFNSGPYYADIQHHIFENLTQFEAENRNTRFQFFVKRGDFFGFVPGKFF